VGLVLIQTHHKVCYTFKTASAFCLYNSILYPIKACLERLDAKLYKTAQTVYFKVEQEEYVVISQLKLFVTT
jgi:hypothetical protein